jgi:uncharacterized protein
MNRVFADAFYYYAIINDADEAHERAVTLSQELGGQIITSAWVLTEVADGLCQSKNRWAFIHLYESLKEDPDVIVLPPDPDLFEEGISLYGSRPDKDWSLTDCISFCVMKREGIREALTGDHHFEQAGFVALLK